MDTDSTATMTLRFTTRAGLATIELASHTVGKVGFGHGKKIRASVLGVLIALFTGGRIQQIYTRCQNRKVYEVYLNHLAELGVAGFETAENQRKPYMWLRARPTPANLPLAPQRVSGDEQ
ncbi:hypothetical protein [Psychromicrobium xiongbiense]|uniref:hypothetical protein n=1 Tax=Psychromicrobium xiongbiense TaxID=3051184 RepID=UPI0025564ED4|nr:hypothetical protein [Psychromicrobium sp. YIM S02556]